MTQKAGLRPGELAVDLPPASDAGLLFIGRIRTPYVSIEQCPHHRLAAGDAEATLDIDQRFAAALSGIAEFSHLQVLFWMDGARRDLLLQTPRHLDGPRGTFSLRSPIRPNPIGLTVVELKHVVGTQLRVSAIECRDGTPLLDIKPYLSSTDSVPDAGRR